MKGSSRDDDLLLSLPEMPLLPLNIDRRSFLMRNAAIGAAAVMTGTVWTPEARAQQATKERERRRWGPPCPLTSTSLGKRRAR